MKIQVITDKSPLYSPETIERRQIIFDQIGQDINTNTGVCLIQSHIVDPTADAYLQFDANNGLKLGFKKNDENVITNTIGNPDFNGRHWISVIDSTTAKIDSLTKVLLFIFGVTEVPSLMETFMSDWADLRTAAQKGTVAELADFQKTVFDKYKENELSSIVMLLNEEIVMKQKFKVISANLSPEKFSTDFLSILNMTDTDHLPRENWALLIKSI